ncbi:MAG: Flp pilus assembly protein CpaB [Paracoccaceae bacterium]|nr:Flp pilus assembly protein CpaB [Paracoccaceae bacterium]
MRLVFGLVLLVGVGLAGFAVYMARGYIGEYETALVREREARDLMVSVTDIYVAAVPLRYGQVLAPEHVKLVKFPENALPEGVFHDEKSLFPDDNGKHRVVLRAIEPNEPLLASKITQPGQEAGVAAFLTAGMRAFTIHVDVTSGVSGFLNPGDRVDVFWSGSISNQGITKLIQSSVKIIGINQSADQDRLSSSVARTVTVEVTPEQVAALAQAQATGKLSLALVGALDTTAVSDIQVNQRTLLGIPETVIIEEVAPEICYQTVRRGSEVERIEVPCSN